MAAGSDDYAVAMAYVTSEIRAPLLAKGSLTQMGIANACVVFTLLANLLRNRTMAVVYGITLCLIMLGLLSAATARSLKVQRFLLACNTWLLFMLLRGVTYVFGWHVFTGSACVLYDLACVATAIASCTRARLVVPSAVVFFTLFLFPHDGASPYIDALPIACARTALMFIMFFSVQFLNDNNTVRFPNTPEIDNILAVPRFAFCLIVHPMFWTAAPVVACIMVLKQRAAASPSPDAEAPSPQPLLQPHAAAFQPHAAMLPPHAVPLPPPVPHAPPGTSGGRMYSATAVRFDPGAMRAPAPASAASAPRAYLPTDTRELQFLHAAGGVATVSSTRP